MPKHRSLNPFTPFFLAVVLLFVVGFVLGSFFLGTTGNAGAGSISKNNLTLTSGGDSSPPLNNLFWWDTYVIYGDDLPGKSDGTKMPIESYFPYAKNSTHPMTKAEAAARMIEAKNAGTPIIIVCSHYQATPANPNPESACVEILDNLVADFAYAMKNGGVH